MNRLLLHYWPELLITIAVWVFIGWQMGLSAFLVTVILSILEITLSADNAVLNSRVLLRLSVFWQRMFLTVGIIFAVFFVRFALPILMVALATGLSIDTIFSLAFNDPEEYGRKLHEVAPLINGFGAMFLIMVALFFFMDRRRTARQFWLARLEAPLAALGKHHVIKWVVAGVISIVTVSLLPPELRLPVGWAMILGIALYGVLEGITTLMARLSGTVSTTGKAVGWAAFSLFMYLQVLDASFSLDGVIGAFVLTSNIFIIMAGLGIGALWVRTMTIYMVRHNTLMKYRFLESGAHWAILVLATIMLLKLFHIELPEIVTGLVGLVFVAGAVAASIRAGRSGLIQ